jgi:site-specific DNA recombinase
MRFAMYVRKSTEDAGESTGSQIQACREVARQHGFAVLDDWVVSEEDVSGRVSRAGLDRIIRAAYRKPRPFDGLLIWAISRGARDMGLTLELFESLQANGVPVWRADQGRAVPFTTPQDKMMLMVEAYGAADQPWQTGQAVRRVLRQKAAQGFHVAGKTFGYQLVRVCQCQVRNCPERGEGHQGHTERAKDKEPVRVVLKIWQLAGDGLGDGRIVERVKHDPAPSPKGWSKYSVRNVLRNEIYRGWVVWGRTSRSVVRTEAGVKGYKRSAVPESEWVREYHPALRIVSDELWERVRRRKEKTLLLYGNQKTLAARGSGNGRMGESGVNVSASLLGSIAKCGTCGGSLVRMNKHAGDAKGRYRCRTRYARGTGAHGCTNARAVPAKVLEDAVRSAVREALEDPKNVDALVQTLKLQGDRWRREREDRRGARANMEREIEQLKLVVARLEDAIERGQPVGDRLKRRRSELAQLEAKRAEPSPPKLTRAELVERIDKALSPLERMMRDYTEAKTEEAQQIREALRTLGVERIVVRPLAKGWRIEGMANLERVIAGGSDAPINMGASPESSRTPRRAPAQRLCGPPPA